MTHVAVVIVAVVAAAVVAAAIAHLAHGARAGGGGARVGGGGFLRSARLCWVGERRAGAVGERRAGAVGDRRAGAVGDRRILFPFFAATISSPALEAALRLARLERATLVAVYLARVRLDLALDAPIPRQADQAMALQEAIEQEAARAGVAVEARIARGRTCRHALARAVAAERFDRLVLAAASGGSPGFGAEDVAWILRSAPGEILVLRPGAPAHTLARPGQRARAL
ncbi:MAG TPA: universal stress protein [Solirubrobacteraceae bacterium]|nr:universal stress protein [Solirubrobacteraceae bacterium]